MSITKIDDVGVGDPNDPDYRECVEPNDLITYTICYIPVAEPNEQFNVVITDHLPQEVYFDSADPNDGEYDEINHTYTWYEGHVPGYDPNETSDPNVCLTLMVRVNEYAEPLGEFENTV